MSTSPLHEALASQRHLLGVAFAISVFVNLLMLTGPLFMLQVYDRVLVSRSEETLVALIGLVVVLYGLMWLLDASRSHILLRMAARLQSRLDGDVFRATLSDQSQAGRNAPRHLDTIQNFLSSPALTAIMDAPFTPLFLVAIFIFHPHLGALALGGGCLLVAITVLGQWRVRGRVSEARRQQEDAQAYADAIGQSAEYVQAQGLAENLLPLWQRRRKEALRMSLHAQDRSTSTATLTKALRLALQSLMLALGALLVLQGELTAGAMIAASILLGRALAPVEQLLGRWTQYLQARQSWRVLASTLSARPPAPNHTALPRPLGISAKGATVSAKAEVPPLLYNVSFQVEAGEALGIIGRSGSGKSTLARVLTGALTPTVGEIRLGNARLAQYNVAELREHIGYLPQDTGLIPGTLAQNIARFDPDARSEDIVAAAQMAGAHDLILSLPEGYETEVNTLSGGLSGGQRQRIALARAVYGDPAILVLDEPNSALDSEGSAALNGAIKAAKSRGQSVIIMTHRPAAISECDRLLMLEKGRVAALGPRDKIVQTMMQNASSIQATLTVEGGAYG